jgi:hypothetical protein
MITLLLLASFAQASDHYECTVQASLTRVEPIQEDRVRADLEIVGTAGGRCKSGAVAGALVFLPPDTEPAQLVTGRSVLLYLHHSDGVTAAGPSSTDSWRFLGVVAEEPAAACKMEAEVVATCEREGCTWLDVMPSAVTTRLGCPPRGVRTRIQTLSPATAARFSVGDQLRGTEAEPRGSWSVARVEAPTSPPDPRDP